MSKKKIFLIIVISAFLGWAFAIFPGRFLEAKISTWPILNKWKILSPQAPIVITNQQTIRVSDSGDAVQSVADVKSKLSLVVSGASGENIIGSAVNLTSDGAFITDSSIFSEKNSNDLSVLLSDGTLAKISQKVIDPATGLAFFRANINNVPVISLGSSKELAVGEKVIFIQSSMTAFSAKSQISYVSSAQSDAVGQVFFSDKLNRCFTAQIPEGILPGQALINTSAELVGIYDGSKIICSDFLKSAESLYFKNSQNILRPSFGFSYQILNKNQSTLHGSSFGSLVKSVEPGSAAQKAGLLTGDLITSVDGKNLDNQNLDEILQNFTPNSLLNLNLMRAGKSTSLKLTPTELK